MAMNLPTSPVLGQQYGHWRYDGTKWVPMTMRTSAQQPSPEESREGDLWWNPANDGQIYVYVTTSPGVQNWVVADPAIGGPGDGLTQEELYSWWHNIISGPSPWPTAGPGGTPPSLVDMVQPSTPSDGQLWFDAASDSGLATQDWVIEKMGEGGDFVPPSWWPTPQWSDIGGTPTIPNVPNLPSPTNTTQFLRADGSWQVPPAGTDGSYTGPIWTSIAGGWQTVSGLNLAAGTGALDVRVGLAGQTNKNLYVYGQIWTSATTFTGNQVPNITYLQNNFLQNSALPPWWPNPPTGTGDGITEPPSVLTAAQAWGRNNGQWFAVPRDQTVQGTWVRQVSGNGVASWVAMPTIPPATGGTPPSIVDMIQPPDPVDGQLWFEEGADSGLLTNDWWQNEILTNPPWQTFDLANPPWVTAPQLTSAVTFAMTTQLPGLLPGWVTVPGLSGTNVYGLQLSGGSPIWVQVPTGTGPDPTPLPAWVTGRPTNLGANPIAPIGNGGSTWERVARFTELPTVPSNIVIQGGSAGTGLSYSGSVAGYATTSPIVGFRLQNGTGRLVATAGTQSGIVITDGIFNDFSESWAGSRFNAFADGWANARFSAWLDAFGVIRGDAGTVAWLAWNGTPQNNIQVYGDGRWARAQFGGSFSVAAIGGANRIRLRQDHTGAWYLDVSNGANVGLVFGPAIGQSGVF